MYNSFPSWFLAISLLGVVGLLLFMLLTGTKVEVGEYRIGFLVPENMDFDLNSAEKIQKLEAQLQQIEKKYVALKALKYKVAQLERQLQQLQQTDSHPSPAKEKTEENSNTAEAYIKIAYVFLSSIELFSQPDLDKGKLISRESKGTRLKILEEKEDWYKVKTPNKDEGWILKQWVELN